ncbi:MAG: hypothetical protein ACRDZW_02050 [Acidimicrobiales bacterium]
MPAYLLAVGISLVFFVLLVQFVVWQYGRGAVRAALDEAARVGAPVEAGVGECEDRAAAVLGDLLGGATGRDVRVTCTETPTQIRASADVVFRSWLKPSPDWSFRITASARKEQVP